MAAAVLLSSLAVASEIVAPAVGCNLGTTAFFDESTRCVGAGLVNGCETSRIHRLNSWRYGGRQFLVVSTMTSLSIYDVTDPLNAPQPKMIGSAYYPWGVVPPSSDWDELQFDAAVADDYEYGIAMFSHYGWVSFKINNPTAPSTLSVKKAVRFAHPDTSGAPRYGRLFKGNDGLWYAVGAYLDGGSKSVAIVSMGADASNPQLVRYLGSQIALAGDPLESARIGDRWWLFVQRISTVGIVDLASATYAYEASSFSTSRPIQDSFVDAASKRLYVLEQGVTGLAPMRIHVVDIATPSSPVERSVITLDLGSYTRIGGDSNVVVVAKQVPGGDPNPTMRAYSVVTPTAPVEIAAGDLNLAGHADEALNDLSVLTASNGNSRVYRAAWSIGTVTTISSGCLPLPPQPAFTVANQSAGNAAAATCGTADAVGFPGDAFDIHDQSSGQVASGTVKVENEAQQTVFGPVSWSSGATWTWASSAAQAPGVYAVTMTLFDQSGAPFPVSRTIRLCCNVAASISGPTEMCPGGSVTLDAGAGFAAYVWSPDGQTTRTITVSPAAPTSYTVAVTTAVGCAATSAQHAVTVLPAPEAPVVAAPSHAYSGDPYEPSWTATGSSGSYELQESTEQAFSRPTAWTVSGTTSVFSHPVTMRTTYYYRVRAVDTCGGQPIYSGWSNVASTVVVPAAPRSSFYTLPPCRVYDTRESVGVSAAAPPLAPLARRDFVLVGRCGIPTTATSVSANVTVLPSAEGQLRVTPGDLPLTTASAVSFQAGRVRANSLVLYLATDGSGSVGVQNDAAGPVDLVIDVNGYFE